MHHRKFPSIFCSLPPKQWPSQATSICFLVFFSSTPHVPPLNSLQDVLGFGILSDKFYSFRIFFHSTRFLPSRCWSSHLHSWMLNLTGSTSLYFFYIHILHKVSRIYAFWRIIHTYFKDGEEKALTTFAWLVYSALYGCHTLHLTWVDL